MSEHEASWFCYGGLWYMIPECEQDFIAHNLEILNAVGDLNGKTVIDIGAHVGTWALPAGSRGARVLAVEASPVAFARLVQGIERNCLSDVVTPICGAVWTESGQIVEIRGAGRGLGASGMFQANRHEAVGWAATLTLEDILVAAPSQRIHLLKMDIEGGEHYVLPEVPEYIWDACNWLAIEEHDIEDRPAYHKPGSKNIDVAGLIASHGFEKAGAEHLWKRK